MASLIVPGALSLTSALLTMRKVFFQSKQENKFQEDLAKSKQKITSQKFYSSKEVNLYKAINDHESILRYIKSQPKDEQRNILMMSLEQNILALTLLDKEQGAINSLLNEVEQDRERGEIFKTAIERFIR